MKALSIIRKLVISTLTATVMVTSSIGGSTIVPIDEHLRVNTLDIAYRYAEDIAKCEKLALPTRGMLVDMLREGSLVINERFVSVVGIFYFVSYEEKGKDYALTLMSSYGQCRFFEDVVIKGIAVSDPTVYLKLKEPK